MSAKDHPLYKALKGETTSPVSSQKLMNPDGSERKHCYKCGSQNLAVPTGFFDEDTGKPWHRYECRNPKCEVGARELEFVKQKNCLHVRKSNWLTSFFTRPKCRKCGKEGYLSGNTFRW